MNKERISLLWEREGSETMMPLTRVRADFMFNGMTEASKFFEELFNAANGNNKARFRPELTVVPATPLPEQSGPSRPPVEQPVQRLVPRFDRPFEKVPGKDTEPR